MNEPVTCPHGVFPSRPYREGGLRRWQLVDADGNELAHTGARLDATLADILPAYQEPDPTPDPDDPPDDHLRFCQPGIRLLPVRATQHWTYRCQVRPEHVWQGPQDTAKDCPDCRCLLDPDDPACPLCGGAGTPLGQLGRRHWLRCRDCGTDYHPLAIVAPFQAVATLIVDATPDP